MARDVHDHGFRHPGLSHVRVEGVSEIVKRESALVESAIEYPSPLACRFHGRVNPLHVLSPYRNTGPWMPLGMAFSSSNIGLKSNIFPVLNPVSSTENRVKEMIMDTIKALMLLLFLALSLTVAACETTQSQSERINQNPVAGNCNPTKGTCF